MTNDDDDVYDDVYDDDQNYDHDVKENNYGGGHRSTPLFKNKQCEEDENHFLISGSMKTSPAVGIVRTVGKQVSSFELCSI